MADGQDQPGAADPMTTGRTARDGKRAASGTNEPAPDENGAKNRSAAKEVASTAATSIRERLEALGNLGAAISAVLATGAVYALGGATMAVRLYEMRLPVERSLSVIPDHDLLILGVRELVLSLVVGGVLFFIAAWRWYVFAGVFSLMVVLVPLTVGGLSWPGALLLLYLYLTFGHLPFGESRPPAWSVAIAVGLAVCAITLVRFTDPPLDLASAVVTEREDESSAGPPAPGVQPQVPAPPPPPPPARFAGTYLSATSDEVFLGGPDVEGTELDETVILSIPRDRVGRVVVLPPPVGDPPHASLLGRLIRRLGGPPFSATPLGVWVDERYYGVRLLR